MRLVVTSDWHPDKFTAGFPRFDDVAEAVAETVAAAIELRADGYVFNGDLCDPHSGPIVLRCAEMAVEAALRLAKHGIRSFWNAGNHDVFEDGTGRTSLAPLCALEEEGITVFERPGYVDVADSVRFLFLPFTAVTHGYDVSEEVKKAFDNRHPVETTIVFSHLHIAGVQPGEETHDMPRGREVLLPHQLLADYAMVLSEDGLRVRLVSGHYHRRQTFQAPGLPPIEIVGSLARLTFGEEQHAPGFLVIDV